MFRVALCADRESLVNPMLLGLDGERLDAQPWISLYDDAQIARAELGRDSNCDEVWVVSNAQIDPINLAAALKKDKPGRPVVLFSSDCGGSLKSRAVHAGVDAAFNSKELPSRYAAGKVKALGAGQEALAKSVFTEPSPLALAVARPNRKGVFVPVVSGSGGVGKSTLCVLLAQLAQRHELSVLVLDLDLQFGDMRELLDVEDPLTMDEVVSFPQRFSQVKKTEEKPVLIASPEHVDQAESLIQQLPSLIEAACQSFDLVIANTGCFWTEQHVLLLERCDKAVFLVDQRPSSLRSCKKALDLCTRCGIAASPFLLVVNRCAKGALYTSIDVSCALYGIPAYELRDGGPSFEETMAASRMDELLAEKGGFVESVERLLGEIVPGLAEVPVAIPAEKKGLSSRLFRGRFAKGEK